MVEIRKFHKEDAKSLSKIIQKTLVEVNQKDYSKEVIQNLCSLFSPENIIELSKKRERFVAFENKKLLGTASLENDNILNVFVHPKYHGKGIGTKLMRHIEKIAKNKGFKKIKLGSSLTAVGFYKKLGYKEIKPILNEEKGKNILMCKRL